MSTDSYSFYRDQKAAARPIWREAFVGLEWFALRASPVFYGLGIPRGDQSAVISVPGFMGTDLYLQELHWWLRRIGYRAYLSDIGRNADCLDLLVDRLLNTIARAHTEAGDRVHLIGHSLGGILALSAAQLRPDVVASVITLGSPFRGIRSHPMVLEMSKLVRSRIRTARRDETKPACFTGYCDCDAVNALQTPCPHAIPHTAVYTKTDGIVDWRVCINDDAASNVEVNGTHIGLVFNPTVYELIARRLAQK
ncbi:MAG TPA: alpha/beta fold hydrolase [Blastocatellia bacterium]|nr:alpha/beta fold hydrolase [Blastocatellia bacterium]